MLPVKCSNHLKIVFDHAMLSLNAAITVFLCKNCIKKKTICLSRSVCLSICFFWKRPGCALIGACALIRTNTVCIYLFSPIDFNGFCCSQSPWFSLMINKLFKSQLLKNDLLILISLNICFKMATVFICTGYQYLSIYRLEVGSYLLTHSPGDEEITLMKSTEGNKR